MQSVQTKGEALREVMRQVPSPVTVVTMRTPEGLRGVTIGSFTSVSLEPPLISFNVQRASQAHLALQTAEAFAVHVLSEAQVDLSNHFARPDRTGEEQFASIEYRVDTHGLPILPGAVAVLRCRPYAFYEAGDHDLVLGEVLEATLEAPAAALLYHNRAYRTVGAEVTANRF
ncbi:MAG: flavin reductase family protein [Bacteroidota bacterium]